MSAEIAITQTNVLANQERMFKFAEFVSKSNIIPKHFHGNPANVFIAMEVANRLKAEFFEIANALYIVNGRPAFSGQFIIGRINGSGLFKKKLNFKTEGSGDKMQVTAYAVSKDGDACEATVSMAMAICEGWTKNIKYKSMPEQMLTYRAATFFCRKHCPEVLLGTRTVEELEDEVIAETIPSPSVVPALNEMSDEDLHNSNVEKVEELFKEAKKLGVDEETLKKLNIDLEKPKSVLKGIDFLEALISDKKAK